MSMSKTEKLSHYAVVFIAVMAVVVSVWQVRISQAHNRLSVRPYMDFFYGWNNDGYLELQLSNQGVGPAIIQKVEYFYDNQKFKSWDEVLRKANLIDRRKNSYTYTGNSPFASGKEVSFLVLDIKETETNLITPLRIVIHYTSIYEENFELSIDL